MDVAIHKGRKDKPLVIFIHGLGMDKDIWIDPLNTRIFAKSTPVKIFTATEPKPCTSLIGGKITLGEYTKKVETIWMALKDNGFNLMCWSQKRPVGPIIAAVNELEDIMDEAKDIFPKTPIALIGHSRGGLVARKFMERRCSEIKALITISTPHSGSSLSRFGKYIKPFSIMLRDILPANTHGILTTMIKNVTNLLEGNALKELLPESPFLKNLKDSPQKGTEYISFGGTEPRLFTIYTWKKKDGKFYPKPLLAIPDSLLQIFPSFLVTDEITPGKGDGLVTAKSSVLPWASRHYNLKANHLSILWDKKSIDCIIEALREV